MGIARRMRAPSWTVKTRVKGGNAESTVAIEMRRRASERRLLSSRQLVEGLLRLLMLLCSIQLACPFPSVCVYVRLRAEFLIDSLFHHSSAACLRKYVSSIQPIRCTSYMCISVFASGP